MTRLLLFLSILLLASPLAAQPAASGEPSSRRALERFRFPAVAATFVQNEGQWPAEVAFLARLEGIDVWVTSTGIVYEYVDRPTAADGGSVDGGVRRHVVRASFVGGQASRVEGRRPKPTVHHYLLGDDPSRWATSVPLYSEVVLEDLYEGVALRLHTEAGVLEHEWVLAPDADEGRVQVEVEGIEELGLPGRAVLDRAAVLGLSEPPARDPQQTATSSSPPLVSDAPTRLYTRFLGGLFGDQPQAIAVDDAGSMYLGGATASFNFPTPEGYDQAISGSSDAFVARIDASGVQGYGTFLGGNRAEEVRGVAYADESVYVTGVTTSPNFPTTTGAYETEGSNPGEEDAFVTRLRLDGSGPVFSTFLGGEEDDLAGGGGDDAGTAIAVAATGAVVVGGRTNASDFPVSTGSYAGNGDAFLIVLSADGSGVQGGTFLGGSGYDAVRALALDATSAYVAGDTDSENFAGLGGGFGGGTDAFVARISGSTGGILGGAYLGGSGLEGAVGLNPNDRTGSIDLALDAVGRVYVSGDTTSDDFPATTTIGPRGDADAFVTRLNPNLTTVEAVTIFGGSGPDRARGVGVAPDGTIHLAGETASDDFPVLDADDGTYGGGGDAFVVQLSNDMSESLYGIYLGGSSEDGAFDLAVGTNGFTYLAGETRSGTDFPVTTVSPSYGGFGDAFAAAYDLTRNTPPTVVAPLDDTTLVLDEPPFTAELAPVFDDADGDALTYSCSTDDATVVSVGDCSDGTLTASAVGVGTATVTVTADDGTDSASDAFLVTVVDNRPPSVVSPIPDAALALGDAPLTVDLDAVFDDPDGDALAFACASSDPAVAVVGGCAGGTLSVTPAAAGAATVTVTATDPDGEAAVDAFEVTVVNPPPTVVSPIPDAVLALGGEPLEVELGAVFDDPNGDALTYTCSSDAPAVASASGCADGVLVVAAESEGSATVTVTASDGEGEATDAFEVEVGNPPPVVARPIPDLALLLGGAPYEVDLDTVFVDPNGDDLSFACESGNPNVASASDCGDGLLTVTAVGVGTTTVTVSAFDGSATAVDVFDVTVEENLPPVVVAPPADAALLIGDAPLTLDLVTVFDDPEDDPLDYTCSSDAPGVASVGSCADGTLTVTAIAGGTATITLTATDPFNPAVNTDFQVTVEEPNAPPSVVSPIPDAALALGDAPLTVDLDAVFDDPDGDALAFACASSDPAVAVVGGCAGGTLSVTPAAAGAATVTVTATDPDGEAAVDAFEVTVVNPPPTVVSPIPDAVLALGGEPLEVELGAVFDDPNGDALTYTCSSDAPAVASASGCADGVLVVAAESEGSATVTVTASDGEGEATDAFEVEVGNPPPVVARPIPDLALLLGGAPYEVDLDTVFVDPNGDGLSYSFGVDASSVLLALDGSVLIVTANALGTATVTVTASDGSGSAAEAFAVAVVDNLPPVVADPPDDTTIVLNNPPLVVDLESVFDDPEGEDLDFTCSSNNAAVASVGDCADGTLTVTAVSVGEARITATATDGNSPGVPVSFIVTVESDNPPPVIVSPIDDVTLALGDGPLTVDLDEVFEDPAGDALEFECESSNPEAATVNDCSEGLLQVTAIAEGAATVSVTATDPDGANATDVFEVAVENPPPVVARPIPDLALLLGGAPYEVDLDTVFVDPNGDGLSYSFGVDASSVLLALDGSVLIVTANALGTATVTVTASDGSGSAAEAFAVAVVDNLPPVVAAPPDDVSLDVGDEPLVLDLDSIFDDPEGDALTFACSSSASNVASVGDCASGTLTVTAVANGTATITITARDNNNAPVTVDFRVTVGGSNAPPAVVAPIDDATLDVEDEPLVIDLTDVFDDSDGDSLEYACESSDVSVVSVGDCATGTLTLTPMAVGTATIEVTARDPADAEATDAFVVTVVNDTDQPPSVSNPLEDIVLDVDASPLVVDLGTVFTDPEGGELTFACASSDADVATASGCASGTLTVTPVNEGAATVTVTATDPGGASAEDVFTVTVGCAPIAIGSVTPTPTDPERGTPVVVTAAVEGASDVTLRYRQGGDESFASQPMTQSGGTYTATIPGSVVTVQGVDYFVEARSACGALSQRAGEAVRVRVPAGVASPVLPAAAGQAGYRLVSVPLDLEDAEAAAVLDDLGPAADEAWRLFELLPPGVTGDRRAAGTDDQWYRSDPTAISVVPGQAYWLIVRDGGSFTTGAGTTVGSEDPFTRDLHSGWNLVGTPFGYDVPLDRVRTESGAPLQLQAYDGSWSNETENLSPFRGYAFRLDADDRLIIDPATTAPSPSVRPTATRQANAPRDEAGWAVHITAETGSARDDNNTALATPSGAEGRDAADWYEPPLIGDYVSVAFTPTAGMAAPLTTDARPVPEEGAQWPFRVLSKREGAVTLTFQGLDDVPEDFVVWLVDEAAATVRDLRRDPAYAVMSRGDDAAAQLRLVIGTEDFARSTSGFDGATPTAFHLAPSYPNPFRAATTIQYALPSDEHVVLDVFDITGRRVAVLVDEVVEAGYHTVVWDGRATGGQGELASGVYLYRFRAGAFTDTHRAVKVR